MIANGINLLQFPERHTVDTHTNMHTPSPARKRGADGQCSASRGGVVSTTCHTCDIRYTWCMWYRQRNFEPQIAFVADPRIPSVPAEEFFLLCLSFCHDDPPFRAVGCAGCAGLLCLQQSF